jgi:hypothetical protein
LHKLGTRKASNVVTGRVSATLSFLPEDDAMPDIAEDPRQFMLGVPLALTACWAA